MIFFQILNQNHSVNLKDLSTFEETIPTNMSSFTFMSSHILTNPNILFSFGNNTTRDNYDARRFKAILWSIAGGTRGGPNRIKILNLIEKKPLNAHQIAQVLNLDYKTITHHIKVLETNSLIIKVSETEYGVNYTMTSLLKNNISVLKEIVSKIRSDV